MVVGRGILYFKEIESTQDETRRLADAGVEEGLVVVAETQTKGRGRLRGRGWASPPGGLWFSTILRPKIQLSDITKLTLVAAVAVAHSIRDCCSVVASVKWPNDVIVNGKKVCGILNEAHLKADDIEYAIVGIGVNVNVEITSLPEEVRDSATSLKLTIGTEVELGRFFERLLGELDLYYGLFKKGGFCQVLRDYKVLSDTIGRAVSLSVGGQKVEGLAVDLDGDGALVVRLSDGSLKSIVSCDGLRYAENP